MTRNMEAKVASQEPKGSDDILSHGSNRTEMRTILATAIIIQSVVTATAQELQKCGADELRISTLREMPKVAEAVATREAELERFTTEWRFEGENREDDEVYLIPVVFHVIHQHGTENISDAQLLDGIRICNETLRKTYPDTADIIEAFKPLHADCGIELRLATKDPYGNCHSGINRIASQLSATGDHAVKSLIHWDPTQYLNVYVTSSAAGLAGHAVWPSDADTIPEWDGIVMTHSYVGTFGTSNQTRSVVFAHEVGHYLNLHHIWGGNNVPGFFYLPVNQAVNCEHDDLVEDTPNTIGNPNCNLAATSCGSLDNVQNAMDYSYCNIMFTHGQSERMRACLNSPIAGRNNLWTEANLIATGVLPEPVPFCGADFMADRTIVCPNTDNDVQFMASVFHGETDSLRWIFGGGNPTTSASAAPTVTYSTPGQYDVTLRAYRNGQMVEESRSAFITVISDQGQDFPFEESFEGMTDVNNGIWAANGPDGLNRWQVTDISASDGIKSIVIDQWEDGLFTRDELYGPPIDLSAVSEMKVSFKYAFAGQQTATGADRLLFQVSRNCESNWSPRLSLSGSQLQTAGPQQQAFIPTAEDWVQQVVTIPSSFLVDGFRFRLVYSTGGNSRFFLDDINVDINASIAQDELLLQMRLYPNPTEGVLSIELPVSTATEAHITVTDLMGRTVMKFPDHTLTPDSFLIQLDVNQLKSGMYVLRLMSPSGTAARPFAVR
jgi:PKD repeat protein